MPPTQPTSPALSQVRCYACGQLGHYANACPDKGRGDSRYNGWVDRPQSPPAQAQRNQSVVEPTQRNSSNQRNVRFSPNPLPPRENSKHPLVNGTETLGQGEKACFRCGSRRHLQTKCDATQHQWLAWWEQAHLKAMMFPAARYRGKGLGPSEVQSRSAQLFYEQFIEDDQNPPDAHEGDTVLLSNSLTIEELQIDEGAKLSEELEGQILILQSLLATAAEEHPNKRRKDGETSIPINSLVDDPMDAEEIKQKRKKPRKPRDSNQPPKPLAEIRGRKGEGPFDYKKLLNTTVIELTLMDILQLSPDFSRNLKHLSVRASEKAKRTVRRYAKMRETVPLNSASATIVQPTKAYRITPRIKYIKNGQPMEYVADADSCQADQGSDVNIIHPALADQLGLVRMKIRDLGIVCMFLLNSAGKTDQVNEFVVFVVVVEGIARPIWAIVQPDGGKLTTLMILGLPWLWDVMATFDIRNSVLTIGDPAVKETPTQIRGPTLAFGGKHRLALIPQVSSVSTKRVEDVDSSESSDSETDDSSSGSESEN
ncbi:hypothetical protein F5Y01DRAFT_264820 [Xylaria sp. FL0043]|nr:hypothetical protein F5Y01DRAFT_264820 [Xylaria sp. FL0043]